MCLWRIIDPAGMCDKSERGWPKWSPTRAAGPGKKFSTSTRENEDFPGLGWPHSGHPGPDLSLYLP